MVWMTMYVYDDDDFYDNDDDDLCACIIVVHFRMSIALICEFCDYVYTCILVGFNVMHSCRV